MGQLKEITSEEKILKGLLRLGMKDTYQNRIEMFSEFCNPCPLCDEYCYLTDKGFCQNCPYEGECENLTIKEKLCLLKKK